MEKYLYLTEIDWADAWINGGVIPISLASTYIREERFGIMTPDENLIHKSEIPIPSLRQYGVHLEQIKNINLNLDCDGRKIEVKNAKFYTEDGLILSFSNSLSESIAQRLEKECCVKITNVDKLRKIIGKQLGCKGGMKECKYTQDHQRNHFLKSEEDAWQDEYRIFWKYPKNKLVRIPAGTAEFETDFK